LAPRPAHLLTMPGLAAALHRLLEALLTQLVDLCDALDDLPDAFADLQVREAPASASPISRVEMQSQPISHCPCPCKGCLHHHLDGARNLAYSRFRRSCSLGYSLAPLRLSTSWVFCFSLCSSSGLSHCGCCWCECCGCPNLRTTHTHPSMACTSKCLATLVCLTTPPHTSVSRASTTTGPARFIVLPSPLSLRRPLVHLVSAVSWAMSSQYIAVLAH